METFFSDLKARTISWILMAFLALFFPCQTLRPTKAEGRTARYVGSIVCKSCHVKQYESFMKYSRKATSFEAIERMKKGLTPDEIRGCYQCHTTGYGRSGGFVSPETTPVMKNAGCEVCHGPGSMHAVTGDRRHIKSRLSQKDCEVCHTAERIAAFRHKPLVHGYAH